MDSKLHVITLTFPLVLQALPGAPDTLLAQGWQVVVHIDGEIAQIPLHTTATGQLQATLQVQGPIQTPDGALDAPMVPLAEYRAHRIARQQKGTPDAQ